MKLRLPAVLLLGLLLAASCAFSQEQPASTSAPTSSPTLTSHSELVLVPVVVTDKAGKHVPGLKAADFEIVQDKKTVRSIAFCDEIVPHLAAMPSTLSAAARVPGTYTNTGNAQRAIQVVVIALDLINTPFIEQAHARTEVIRFLSESVPPGTSIALLLMTPSGVRMLHDFSSDSNTLIAALQKVAKGKPHGKDLVFPPATSLTAVDNEAAMLSKFEFDGNVFGIPPWGVDTAGPQSRLSLVEQALAVDAGHRDAVRATTDSLLQIAQAYSGIPGRKALVWMTSGLPASIESALLTYQGSVIHAAHETDVSADFAKAWKALNQANFSVYPVDVRGLFTEARFSGQVPMGGSAWSGGGESNHHGAADPIERQLTDETFHTIQSMAEMTGGKAYMNTNDLAGSIRRAVDDTQQYYMLGFYVEEATLAPGWHPLKVTTRQTKTTVRSREGFFATPVAASSAELIRSELASAIHSPVQFGGLPILVRWSPVTAQPAEGKKHVAFDLVVDANSIQPDPSAPSIDVSLLGVALNAESHDATDTQRTIRQRLTPEAASTLRKNGLLYRGEFVLTPGSYVVHFAVRDNQSGRLGSVIVPLSVP